MLLIQLTGLSGAGKSSIAEATKIILDRESIPVEVIDGDFFRQHYCSDLGFSKQDRCENIRRMGTLAVSSPMKVVLMAAINPYEAARLELHEKYNAKTVLIDCAIPELIKRDTKGLYHRAFLPVQHPDKVNNLSGINDPFEFPLNPHLVINTNYEPVRKSSDRLVAYIKQSLIEAMRDEESSN